MKGIDIESLVLLGVIIYAWLMRRKGLTAVQKLNNEQRKVFFKEFGPWRWRHYGVLALLILLPGIMLWKPNMDANIHWGLAVSEFIVTSIWFSLGYHFLQQKMETLMDDPQFIKDYFADRFPMGLLYIVFTFVALQRVGLIPKFY